MRKITARERAVQVKAYKLASELRAFLPSLVRDLGHRRFNEAWASGRRGPDLADKTLASITATELAEAIRTVLLAKGKEP